MAKYKWYKHKKKSLSEAPRFYRNGVLMTRVETWTENTETYAESPPINSINSVNTFTEVTIPVEYISQDIVSIHLNGAALASNMRREDEYVHLSCMFIAQPFDNLDINGYTVELSTTGVHMVELAGQQLRIAYITH